MRSSPSPMQTERMETERKQRCEVFVLSPSPLVNVINTTRIGLDNNAVPVGILVPAKVRNGVS